MSCAAALAPAQAVVAETRSLLIRRRIVDASLAFFTTWCPAGTGIDTLVRVEGRRWAIEDAFETAKNKLVLDRNETRSWHGWHRHVSLAFAMLATVKHLANDLPPSKSRAAEKVRRWCAGQSRKSAG